MILLTDGEVINMFWTPGNDECYWSWKEDVPLSEINPDLNKRIYNILINPPITAADILSGRA